MKRYLLFAGYIYYPEGGMNDFVNSFDTEEDARDGYIEWSCKMGDGIGKWGHIFDTLTKNKITIE